LDLGSFENRILEKSVIYPGGDRLCTWYRG